MKAESKAIIMWRYGCLYTVKVKPLSSISDEDAKLLEVNEKLRGFITIMPYHNDALRQLGYATQQTVIEDGKVVTYTVDELVKEGVFKLI